MTQISMHQLRLVAATLGHDDLRVFTSRRGLNGSCGCGFRSGRVPTQALAEQAIADHVQRAVDRWWKAQRASGRNPASIVAALEHQEKHPDTPTEIDALSGVSATL